MSVLPAILPDARDIPLYIARIQIRLVERRGQELDQCIVPANEPLIHRFHCHARAFGIPGAGENRPALRNGINLAFGITRRTEWRAIIEVSAEVPLTIPAILLDIPAQLSRLSLAAFDKGQVTMQACNLSKPHEHFIKEESQPNAFAFAVFAHHVHAVVPITRADKRQTVLAKANA